MSDLITALFVIVFCAWALIYNLRGGGPWQE